MDIKITEEMLIRLYIDVDDLHQSWQMYEKEVRSLVGKLTKPTREPDLSPSEVCCIIAGYHLSGYKCFEYYYHQIIQDKYGSYFPKAPSYERFVSLMARSYPLMWLWSLHCCLQSRRNGLYFIDSKKMEVCHIKREHSHKVFGNARKGKSSTGWFYGFKLHLVINSYGEIVNWLLTPANVADNNQELLIKLLKGLEGICIGDRGYHTALFEWFYVNKLHLIVKPKKNMKQNVISLMEHQQYLKKRALIESVNDILVSVCDVEHSRHRKPENAFASIAGAIIAYRFIDDKPCIFIKYNSHKLGLAA
ncbi:MAG: IS982 family transposase [Spirosomaceae bacterium]|jgi:hypothetical protein|nr:IS982 family transposase [Spirosomataceae bacterium]